MKLKKKKGLEICRWWGVWGWAAPGAHFSDVFLLINYVHQRISQLLHLFSQGIVVLLFLRFQQTNESNILQALKNIFLIEIFNINSESGLTFLRFVHVLLLDLKLMGFSRNDVIGPRAPIRIQQHLNQESTTVAHLLQLPVHHQSNLTKPHPHKYR